MTVSLASVRHLLIDLDGVIYRGDMALPHARRFVEWLRTRSIAFRLVTNNATLTPQQYTEKLARMGISVTPEEIFTSALATGMYLSRQATPGETVLVVGEDGLEEAAEAADLKQVDEDADWVVVGLDRNLTYDKLARAALSIERGAHFVGSNPDTSYPSERGLVPGAGALLSALQATTGVEPVVIGKPKPLMLELAMQHLGGSVTDTAMLGDRLDTDIRAANGLGMPSILVLTGVSTRAELARTTDRPDLVVADLAELMERWTSAEPASRA